MIQQVVSSCHVAVITFSQNEISLESSPKVFLQNKLARCRKKLEELESALDAKRENDYLVDAQLLTRTVTDNEAEKYTNLIASCSVDNTLGNTDDALNVLSTITCDAHLYQTYFLQGYLDAKHQVTFFATSALVLRTEIDTITAALGGKLG